MLIKSEIFKGRLIKLIKKLVYGKTKNRSSEKKMFCEKSSQTVIITSDENPWKAS